MLIGTTNLNTTLNLTYVLTDVVETLLLDMRSDKTQFSTQENFGNDSDCLLAFIKLLIDRCGDDDKKMFAFYNYIKSYPSQLGLELSDEKSVFAHIFN
jgi:hypothetical protein